MDAAYTTLRDERFPAPLPFHQPLENLRRYFDKFEVPLPLAMERLRKNDDLERGANPYGWRDILMEELGLSRAEYEILTDSNGRPPLAHVRLSQRRRPTPVVIDDALQRQAVHAAGSGSRTRSLVAILKTRFVNPNSDPDPEAGATGRLVRHTQGAQGRARITGQADFDALLP